MLALGLTVGGRLDLLNSLIGLWTAVIGTNQLDREVYDEWIMIISIFS
jgi:hypothetical protein